MSQRRSSLNLFARDHVMNMFARDHVMNKQLIKSLYIVEYAMYISIDL